MQSKKSSSSRRAEPTQKYLKIAEVKEDTVVLKDGGLRAVVVVSSTNFALKSEDEQNALIAAYQGFLNSLEFPIQILIHSRVLDINGYLEKLRGMMAGQTNELLRIQMSEYIEYVGRLVEYSSIMSKNFYVVVPYSGAPTTTESFGAKLTKLFNPAAAIASHQEDFAAAKLKLAERVERVISGLSGSGLRCMILKTAELVELLYISYNFEVASPLRGASSLEEIQIGEPEKTAET